MLTGAALFQLAGALISALPQLLKFLNALHEGALRDEARKDGYTAAIAKGLELSADQLARAAQARTEAEAEHNAHPGDDSGFDKRFQRGE